MEDLLRALALPFRTASLLFVGLSSLLLTLLTALGGAVAILGLFALYVTAVALTRYAFRMIEDAANGARDPAVVDIEMFNPVGDPRCFIHPALGLSLVALHLLRPEWPVIPTLVAAALLFPPSIAATVMSGRARDALNPRAIGGVIRGWGIWYPLTVLATVALFALGLLLDPGPGGGWLAMLVRQMVILLVCAWIGGAIYLRRFELGFAARLAPERKAEAAARERDARRQQVLDAVYRDLRLRETARAVAHLRQWISDAGPAHLPADVDAILGASRTWDVLRELPQLLRALAAQLQERRQTALALQVAEAGLAADATFAPGDETALIAIAEHARRTGRRREAVRLIENFLQALPQGASAGPQLLALREALGPLR